MIYGDFRPYADSANFIVAHPQGLRDLLNNTHFNVGWGNSSVDDLGFANVLLDTIITNYSIDTTEIYSTGFSNGGFMSYLLACQLGNRFAAIASVAGDMSPNTFTNCTPKRAVPILQIHGTNDNTVPYNGNSRGLHIDSVISYWVGQNQTATTPIVTNLPNSNTADGSTVTSYKYLNGSNSSEVHLYKIFNGDHTWPGVAGFGNPNLDIDGTKVVWNFLKQFNLSGKKTIVGINENLENSKFILRSNLTSESISVESPKATEYQLLNSIGEVVKSGKIQRGQNIINLSVFKNAMYFLKIEKETFKVVLAK